MKTKTMVRLILAMTISLLFRIFFGRLLRRLTSPLSSNDSPVTNINIVAKFLNERDNKIGFNYCVLIKVFTVVIGLHLPWVDFLFGDDIGMDS